MKKTTTKRTNNSTKKTVKTKTERKKSIPKFSDGVNTPKGYKIELSGETESINLVLRDVGLMTLFIVPILYDIFNGKRKQKTSKASRRGKRSLLWISKH